MLNVKISPNMPSVATNNPWGQCYKNFYRGNLPPFHGNTIILCYKAILPMKLHWNGSKLPRYFKRKSKVQITAVIYLSIVL
jgi:hypothetical protein